MHFYGRPSQICYLAHVIALIAGDVLNDLKAGSAKEAKKALDSQDAEAKGAQYNVPDDGGRSAIAKVRLLNLWILRGSQREQDWNSMPKTLKRRPIYDVDTRWNSAYDMIAQFLELEVEYTAFIESYLQVECLLLSKAEIVALT